MICTGQTSLHLQLLALLSFHSLLGIEGSVECRVNLTSHSFQVSQAVFWIEEAWFFEATTRPGLVSVHVCNMC